MEQPIRIDGAHGQVLTLGAGRPYDSETGFLHVLYEGLEYELRPEGVFGVPGAQRNEPTPDGDFDDPVVDEDYADEIVSCGEVL